MKAHHDPIEPETPRGWAWRGAIGVLLLLLWIPLRQKPGLGTILNALEIGVTVDLIMPLIPDSDRLVVRVVYLAAGIVIIAIGSGFYIGSGLGAGPRDGLPPSWKPATSRPRNTAALCRCPTFPETRMRSGRSTERFSALVNRAR